MTAHTSNGQPRSGLAAWAAAFAGLIALSLWVHRTEWFARVVLQPLAEGTAWLAAVLLQGIGMAAQSDTGTILIGTRSFTVDSSCTGVMPLFLLAAAVLTAPRSWPDKLKGIIAGGAALLGVNLVRVVFIVLMSLKAPQSFWTMHVVVGQVLVIGAALLIFVLWARLTDHSRAAASWSRQLLKRVGLFIFGFSGGYVVYGWFLSSPLGAWTHTAVAGTVAWVLGLFTQASAHQDAVYSSVANITLVPGCLSSPVVVIMMGVVCALPVRWWKRLLLIGIGFWPLYFVYHVLRVLLVMISLHHTPREASLIYYVFGQYALLVFAFMLVAWYHEVREGRGLKRVSLSLGKSLGAAIPVALLAGSAFQHGVIPLLTGWISGRPDLSYDANFSLSTMMYFETFVVAAVLLYRKGFGRSALRGGLCGLVAIFLLSALKVAVIEFFGLKPHPGVIQFTAVALPFGLAYLILHLQDT